MINTRFSLLRAHFTGVKMLLEYISFYVVWYAVVLMARIGITLGLGLYADLLDYKTLTQNWSWINTILKSWLSEFKFDYSIIPNDVSVYGLLNYFFPSSIVNHSLEIMSWSEYFNIIIFPKKIILLALIFVIASLSMSVSVGFIKTALSFQSNGTASFHDMYRYLYLVPSYFATKIIMLVACMMPLGMLLITYSYMGPLMYPGILTAIFVTIFMYQRLRFAKYFVIDQGENPSSACIASWKLTKGCVFHLLIFSLCTVVLIAQYFSGILMCFFVTLDTQAEASVYRQLMGQQD